MSSTFALAIFPDFSLGLSTETEKRNQIDCPRGFDICQKHASYITYFPTPTQIIKNRQIIEKLHKYDLKLHNLFLVFWQWCNNSLLHVLEYGIISIVQILLFWLRGTKPVWTGLFGSKLEVSLVFLANFVLIKVHQGHFNLKCLDFSILILFKMRRFRVNQLFE